MTEKRKEYKIDGRPSTIYRVVKNNDIIILSNATGKSRSYNL